MRIDKLLSGCGLVSRTEAVRAAKAGQIAVNGQIVTRTDIHINPDSDAVTFCGQPVVYRRYTYIMLNKPDGYLSATEDGRGATVMELLPPEFFKMGLFPCGRLDKDTFGLLVLTNDGETAHRLLSPRRHVVKTYRFTCAQPLTDANVRSLETGVDIGGYVTRPAAVRRDDGGMSGTIAITEGKFHQIKRMLEAVENQITSLERVSFGSLPLDPSLARGAWRYLTDEEIAALKEDCT